MKRRGLWAHTQHSQILVAPFPQGIGQGGYRELFAGVLLFSVVVVVISALIIKRQGRMDRTEMATYVVLIAWGSLLWGLFLSKCAR